MKKVLPTLSITTIVFASIISILPISHAFEFSWQIDETPEGQESATVVQPVEVIILDEAIEVADDSASIRLMQKYSVHLGEEWDVAYTHRLLRIFESIPQTENGIRFGRQDVLTSVWILTDRHVHNDIEIEWHGEVRIVTIAADAFTYATPLLAEIKGVRGRYFSKRLHRAVVRFVTDNGADRRAINKILHNRYNVSISVRDYTKLTQHTTGEDAGRFMEFKNEELMALLSMLEEYPSGMLKTPGLKYIIRRLDGTPHPTHPAAPAVSWTSEGYIEFMDSAFQGQGLDYIHRLILHEKAHFLWAHLFNEQLKQDWIELGGWYENPDDIDGWSTTKQTEFVSAYAHGNNPNEDMAESISFYIVRPDKLRSRAPAKYEFIQNRIMHGTRYISQIREDLTFEVYNLYPDYVYPGKVKRIDIKVEGEPTEDKLITVELEIHRDSDLDGVSKSYIRVHSDKGTYFDIVWMQPAESRTQNGQILRGQVTLSRYAASGYWFTDQIRLWDANGNERLESQSDFGWKLYIDNPLADCEPPQYVPNSMRLSLSNATTKEGMPYQVVTASWQVIEHSGLGYVRVYMNDAYTETYSRRADTRYDRKTDTAMVKLIFPEYMPGGIYKVNRISMRDIARNGINIYFTDDPNDEPPQTIEIKTKNPDFEPPELDINNITIKAEPTIPDAPNGETIVDITFKVKDNISGYTLGGMRLRDPQGVTYHFYHYPVGRGLMYFAGDPTVYKEYKQNILLPVGSVPGIWGLAEMAITDKAGNTQRYDFTEIVRFEVDDTPSSANKTDVNGDGKVNILDLVFVANAFDEYGAKADVNGDGVVSILDLVLVASAFGNDDMAAPSLHKNDLQNWLTLALQNDNGSYRYRQGLNVLRQILRGAQPEKTALLPNYPNPFNPETWIPYHLAKPADVTLTIYGANGAVVRTLALGHQDTGIYQIRSRAAYWDGKNEFGESVASGVYFYTLTAGDFSATRKMLIRK